MGGMGLESGHVGSDGARLAGVHCEINVDDCNPPIDPVSRGPKCFNNGTCVDQVGGYSCSCPPGFVGERCEGDVNECLSNPCSSEGSLDCIQLTNDYLCVCRSTFTGELSTFPAALATLPRGGVGVPLRKLGPA